MKNFLTLISLCFVVTMHAQYKSDSILLTKTEWVTKNLDYLRFFKDSVVYNLDETKHQLIFDIKNNKLSFKIKYRVGGTDIKTEEFNFKVKGIGVRAPIFATIIMSLFLFVFNYFVNINLFFGIIEIIFGAGIYFGVLILIKGVGKEDWELVRRFFKK